MFLVLSLLVAKDGYMAERIRILILLCLLNLPFLTTQAQAWTLYDDYEGGWYVDASVGRSSYKMDKDNFINPGPFWPSDHYYKNSIHDASFVGVGAGYAWRGDSQWLPVIMAGLDFSVAVQGKVSGFINQYNLPQFHNYSYSYDFSRQTLLAVVKGGITSCLGWMPYLTAGTGPSFNRASSYSEEPLANVTPRISPGYGTATHSSWSYMIGAGIGYELHENTLVSLEYNYSDFGSVRTSNGAGTPTVTGVNYSDVHLSNTLKANSLLLRVSYLLNCI